MRRSVTALLLLALTGFVLVPASAAGPTACPVAGQVVPRGDGWTSVRPGTLPTVSAAAVSPADSARLWATDGQVLQRSTDRGCRWAPVAALGDGAAAPSLPLDSTGSAGITQVATSGEAGREVVWTSEDDAVTALGTVSRVRVSTDGGASFHATSGLPALGPLRLGVADQHTAYVLAAPLPVAPLPVAALPVAAQSRGTAVWVSTDSGARFTQRATIPDAGLRAVVADPGSPGTAYAWSDQHLWVSTDAGVSFRPVALRDGRGGQTPTIAAVDAGPARLAVLLADGWLALSTDAGTHFTVTPAPAGVDSVTHLPGQPAVLVVSTAAGNAAFVPGGPAWDLTPVPGGVHDLRSSRDGTVPVVLGHTGSSLYVRTVTAVDLRAPAPTGTAPGALTTPLRAGALRPVGPPSLLPADARVSVQPGTVRRVGYQLRLPPVSGPLDVYFLVDTTPSMREALDGLRAGVQGIVEDLARAQLDVQFGVGDFRDLDDLVTLDPARHAYRRDAPIGPAGPALSTALASLRIAAGGKDIPEAQTIALTQAATGAGMPGVVPVGQQAGFRPTATKVIVLITDAPFHQEPPYPSMAQTVADLHSRGIKVVSLAVNNDFASTDPRPDERAVALGTATLAPVEGIDCQGTGMIDVPAGAPAVCPVDTAGGGPLSIAAPIKALLRDVQDLGTVEVTVSGAGLLRTVGVTSEITNLAQPRPLTFALDLTCRPAQAGSSLALTLAGRVNGRPVVRTQAVVACLSVPALAVAASALPPPRAPQQVLEVPPVGLPPGAPVSQGQPGAQPNANPNVNPNVNPNIAGATAEQQQHQAELALALAEQDSAEAPDQVMAMVSRPRRSENAALGVLAVSLVMTSVAGGLALRAGTRTAPVLAPQASQHRQNV